MFCLQNNSWFILCRQVLVFLSNQSIESHLLDCWINKTNTPAICFNHLPAGAVMKLPLIFIPGNRFET
jgi:hypothetical protein